MLILAFIAGIVVGIVGAVFMFTLLSDLDEFEFEESCRRWEDKSGYKVVDDEDIHGD